ncbi:PIN domain-containing protein [Ilumatobacter sp.]|uniref:PIN domain-containing protein n=1 Tax=Ilumatobacter sp. TaxID=1967498 RepID=UPI003C449F8A
MRALLDTSVLIATDVPTLDGELAISAASIAELHFGVMVTADDSTRAERLRRLTMLQRSFDAIPIDDEVAASYGRLAAAVAYVGHQPRSRVLDLLIAATAHAHGARLYTRNAADLAGLDDLLDIVTV